MTGRTAWLLALSCASLMPRTATAQGQFEGRVVVEWLVGGNPERDMRLLEPFAFIDSLGKRWNVPAGTVVNGASIPQPLWSLAGSPYTGNYRRASVVHDHYCDLRKDSWESVHRMFYHAMIAGGFSEVESKAYYAAVYAGGPRWKVIVSKSLEGETQTLTVSQKASAPRQAQEATQRWIRANNPTLDDIDARLRQVITVR